MNSLKLRGKEMKFPMFFPDATYGHVVALDNKELSKTGIKGVVVNTYHFLKTGLIDKAKLVGIHKHMGIPSHFVAISDSGGFQVMSLIHKSSAFGRIEENKVVFFHEGKEIELTPEKCIQLQIKLGSDIVMCLDECTKPDMTLKEQEKSVDRTVRWAERCKKEFVKLTKGMKENERPLLFGIVQGGESKKLRKKCAEALIKIGFDGYSFGGWPVKKGILLKEILKYTADLLPEDKPKYAMGVGKPEDLVVCTKLGYDMFDCVIPTRDARHKRLYVFKSKPLKGKIFVKELNIKSKMIKDKKSVSKYCDCELCKKYTKSELYKMFRDRDDNARRLSTVHNLTVYSKVMELLKR